MHKHTCVIHTYMYIRSQGKSKNKKKKKKKKRAAGSGERVFELATMLVRPMTLHIELQVLATIGQGVNAAMNKLKHTPYEGKVCMCECMYVYEQTSTLTLRKQGMYIYICVCVRVYA
jgi:hypothetical protein